MVLKFNRPVKAGVITSRFHEQRGDKIHGGLDFGELSNDDDVYPVEDGYVFGYVAFRYGKARGWNISPLVHGKFFPWRNYFTDWAGGVIVNESLDTLRTHVMLHFHPNQMFGKIAGMYHECNMFCMWTPRVRVNINTKIGKVGNDGKSTDYHVHLETHHHYKYDKHHERINPEDHL